MRSGVYRSFRTLKNRVRSGSEQSHGRHAIRRKASIIVALWVTGPAGRHVPGGALVSYACGQLPLLEPGRQGSGMGYAALRVYRPVKLDIDCQKFLIKVIGIHAPMTWWKRSEYTIVGLIFSFNMPEHIYHTLIIRCLVARRSPP